MREDVWGKRVALVCGRVGRGPLNGIFSGAPWPSLSLGAFRRGSRRSELKRKMRLAERGARFGVAIRAVFFFCCVCAAWAPRAARAQTDAGTPGGAPSPRKAGVLWRAFCEAPVSAPLAREEGETSSRPSSESPLASHSRAADRPSPSFLGGRSARVAQVSSPPTCANRRCSTSCSWARRRCLPY